MKVWRVVAAGVGAAAALAVLAATGGAMPSTLSVGRPFTLATGSPDSGVAASGLGSDGSVWSVLERASGSFAIAARARGGRGLGPLTVAAPSGFDQGIPVVSVSGATATFAWLVVRQSSGDAAAQVRTCTLSGCRPTQTIARWAYTPGGAPVFSGASAVGLASAGGRTVLVFYRTSGGRALMEWSQSTGGRFSAPRALATITPSVSVDIPVLTGEAGGRIVAVWPHYRATGFDLGYALWSARGGFAPAGTIPGGQGPFTDGLPVVAAAGAGAAVAWIQGTNATDPQQEAEPIWFARQSATGFGAAAEVFDGDAGGLSMAGGGGVLALAFTTARPGFDIDGDGPAMVIRSVDGAPFGTPTELASSSAPFPTVSVDAHGDTLAAWDLETHYPRTSGPTSVAQLAFAPPSGAFGAPARLGTASSGDLIGEAPSVHCAPARCAVVWQSAGGDVRAALATP